jgi:ATP-dependent DNA ligase
MLRGRDVMAEPLVKRRELIEKHVLPKLGEPIRYSPILETNLTDLIHSVKAQGLEGLVAAFRIAPAVCCTNPSDSASVARSPA